MKKATAALLALALLLVLAFFLNPSPEKHRASIKAAIGQRSPLAGVLGLGALAAFVSNYHSLGVASYTEVNGKTASIGAFGYVHVRELESRK
jgi:hypothetical protein